MTTYDYKIAKSVLTETEKDRALACFLNMTDTNAVNWQKAADDFGSASLDSFKVMIRAANKKIKAAEAKAGIGGDTAPPSTGKAKGGKKRKAVAEEIGDDAEEAPKPKKRGRKPKAETPVVEEDGAADDEAETKVKEETGDAE